MRIRIIGAVIAVLLAAIGGYLLWMYVQSADQRAAEGAEFAQVYVVIEEIPSGTPGELISDYIEVDELPQIAIQPDIVTSLDDLAGLVTNAELLPGEQLLEARFSTPAELAAQGDVALPEGFQEVTLPVEVARAVGGAVRPGATVGVVITVDKDIRAGSSEGSGSTETSTPDEDVAGTTSKFTFHKMLVTRVQAGTLVTTNAEEEVTTSDVLMITFAANTSQIEQLVWAAELQDYNDSSGIWLTLEPEDADEDGSREVTRDNIFE
ncbi:hypothetical protein ARHIZOSPH14_10880 [Agromyces rhizosphaerae]|uniref:Flp pilus assembly protein CpaB n=1 Tax=Agromyces rhizosphaerae TaxID=88374 RepID=A0A9W6CQ79_9MICO|nr:RcpC/CpaB family pilus assembly protein [Agromyces rhizosphaerae]GLI26846.1 hypothetical protein ARHIZOSPH14_10880 [Agromyces rhizosphaerae]